MSQKSKARRKSGEAARANAARAEVVSDVMELSASSRGAYERGRGDGNVVIALEGKDGKLQTITRAATSYIQQRIQLATRAGITFNGQRDMYYTLGYLRVIMWFDLAGRYQRGGIAQRLVNAPCRATWRAKPEIIEDPDPAKVTKFEEAFTSFADRTRLFHYIERADVVSGIGRYGCLLLGGGGPDLSQPLRKGADIRYLAVFSEYAARILSLETNPASERFGLPDFYRLNLGTDLIGGAPAMQFVKVHWSRIIHFAEDRLEDEIFGIPRMVPVWNYLDDLEKVVGGSAEAFWQTADRGIQADVDKDLNLLDDDASQLSDEIDEYMNGRRRFIRTQGVKLNVLGAQVADPTGPFKAIISLIAGARQIPQRVLMGTEAGHLASTEDGASWKETISDRQNLYAEPCILRPLIDRLVQFGVLPQPENKLYQIHWPDLLALSESDRATNAMRYGAAILNVAQAHQFAIQSGVKPLITDQEARAKLLGLEAEPAEGATYGGLNETDLNQARLDQQNDGANNSLDDPAHGAADGDPGNDQIVQPKGKDKSINPGKGGPKSNPQAKADTGKGVAQVTP